MLLQLKRREESEAALESLRSDLERQHQEDVSRLKAQWKTDTQAETELRVRAAGNRQEELAAGAGDVGTILG